MTDHTPYRDLLAMRHDLIPDEETTLLAHLNSCAECRSLAEEYARQDDFLRGLRLPEPPLTFGAGVLGRAHTRGRTWRPLFWRHGVGLLSAVAVLALLVVAIHSTSGTSRSAGSAAGQSSFDRPARGQKGLPANTSPHFGPQAPAAEVPPPTIATGAATNSQSDAAASAAVKRSGTGSIAHRGATAGGNNSQPTGAPLTVDQPLTAVSESHGLQLSISVPPGTWAKGTIVPVHVTIRNGMGRYVTVLGDGWQHRSCPSGKPGVEVIDARGKPIYPPLNDSGPMPRCPGRLLASPTSLLRPGQSRTADIHVVLKANRLRAAATVMIYTGCNPTRQTGCQGTDIVVYGRVLRIRSTR